MPAVTSGQSLTHPELLSRLECVYMCDKTSYAREKKTWPGYVQCSWQSTWVWQRHRTKCHQVRWGDGAVKPECTVKCNVKWWNGVALHREPITELWSVTCHKGSYSVACHPTQVNAFRHNPSQRDWYSIYLSQRDEKLSWFTYPGAMKGWVDLGAGYNYTEMVYVSADSHPSK